MSIENEDEYTIRNIDEGFLPEPTAFWHSTPTYQQGQLFFVMNAPQQTSDRIDTFQSKGVLQYDGAALTRLF